MRAGAQTTGSGHPAHLEPIACARGSSCCVTGSRRGLGRRHRPHPGSFVPVPFKDARSPVVLALERRSALRAPVASKPAEQIVAVLATLLPALLPTLPFFRRHVVDQDSEDSEKDKTYQTAARTQVSPELRLHLIPLQPPSVRTAFHTLDTGPQSGREADSRNSRNARECANECESRDTRHTEDRNP